MNLKAIIKHTGPRLLRSHSEEGFLKASESSLGRLVPGDTLTSGREA